MRQAWTKRNSDNNCEEFTSILSLKIHTWSRKMKRSMRRQQCQNSLLVFLTMDLILYWGWLLWYLLALHRVEFIKGCSCIKYHISDDYKMFFRDDFIFVFSMFTSFLAFILTALWFNERNSNLLKWIFLSGPMYSAIFACR